MKLPVKSKSKVLVQAIGNPLRSDDAVGPLFIEQLSQYASRQPIDDMSSCFYEEVDFEWVYQLQVENAEQWSRYEAVIVVDAHARATQAVSWREIIQQENFATTTFSSHQQSPDFIYQLMRRFFEQNKMFKATRVFELGIQAQDFGIGEVMSSVSAGALKEAEEFLNYKLRNKELI